jgi:hypothetical protein
LLDYQTLEKLVSMRLSAMGQEYRRQLESAETGALSFEERFAMLIDAEWTARQNSRLKRLLRQAKLRIPDAYCRSSPFCGVNSPLVFLL